MNDIPVPPLGAPSLPAPDTLRQLLRTRQRVPVSTYRLQLHRDFSFRAAAALVAYLDQLGITDCYCSPFLKPRPGSPHGYDITDHSQLNPELGSAADFQAFTAALTQRHMGLVLDFVPNHMGVDPLHNRWWRDVLESGRASPYARFFDIDWDPVKPELKGKVLLPVLGGSYGEVLERGELQLALDNGALVVRSGERHWPLDPRQLPELLRHDLEALQAELKADDPQLQEYLSILTQLEHLPATTETDAERIAERQREKEVARERLVRLLEQAPRLRQHLDAALVAFNGRPGDSASFDRLHDLLEGQPYRLAYWKTALHEINYRRFFDINDLAGLRMEDPAVFSATHALVLDLIRQGQVTGLRLDHLDGLFDPAGYLERLQEAVCSEIVAAEYASGGPPTDAWRQKLMAWRAAERHGDPGGPAARPCYLLPEKILSANETLPESWPCHGTSGYDFLNDLNRLFVDPQHMKRLRQIYGRFTGQQVPFAEIVYECKKLITRTSMASELNVLAHALNRISEGDRRLRDFTLISLRQALREVVACFPIYRTYVNAGGATETDRQMIDVALSRARRRNPAMEPSVFRFIGDVLLPDPNGGDRQLQRQRLDCAMKFQQYTGPVQAKGVEDTAFYRYNVLLSLNEVGGDPQRFGAPPAQFHEANRRRHERWPHSMLATATHDTKRGEDARARLNVISEIPEEWRRRLFQWGRLNAGCRTAVDGEPAPDRNDECFFYQALLGAWPPTAGETTAAPSELVARLSAAMTKATKEAKVHTSWINPNEAYDAAVVDFVTRTLTGPRAQRFLEAFLPLARRVAQLGMVNSLAQLTLKLASPGVPDFYQGAELWDLSFVDPDNRRPVDYAQRQRLLHDLEPLLDGQAANQSAAVTELWQHWDDGRIKLFLTACGLRLRRRLPRVFLDGSYVPLEIDGRDSEHVIGLARRHEQHWVLAVVPRLLGRLLPTPLSFPWAPETWQNTNLLLPREMDTAPLWNVLTGEFVSPTSRQFRSCVAVSHLLRAFPVALLVSNAASPRGA